VRSGTTCIDKYEASVWETTDPTVIGKIKEGTVTLADLKAAGAIQRGVTPFDYGAGCPETAEGCVNFYAVSIPGVMPSAFINQFQAAATARNSGKRLPTNAEWQAAALGTPDSGVSAAGSQDCNTANGGGAGVDALVATGSRSNCVSDVGAFDMVGNVQEWVADWVPRSTACPGWGSFSDDGMCLAGADTTTTGPGALLRGSEFHSIDGLNPGVFAVTGFLTPLGLRGSFAFIRIGFRAAR